jgi:rhodanese-related sulfurtransferase
MASVAKTLRATFSWAVLGVLGVLVLAGCGGDSESPGIPSPSAIGARAVTASEAVGMLDLRTIIDVRNPDEFAAGHIAGAVNIPVEAADFGTRITELDREGSYLVYCRSGRRSALATDLMAAAGFTDVVDAGGQDALVQAGARTE